MMPASKTKKETRYIYLNNQIFQVKDKNWLIVKLKAIKSKKNTFFYLSIYLHCSFI